MEEGALEDQMIILKLLDNKDLSIYKLDELYQKENLITSIDLLFSDRWFQSDYEFILCINGENNDAGVMHIYDGQPYSIPMSLLAEVQNLHIWIEIRKGEIIGKSSTIVLRVNKSEDVNNIAPEPEISVFDQVLQRAMEINEETKELKKEIDYIVSGRIQDIEDYVNDLKTKQILVIEGGK